MQNNYLKSILTVIVVHFSISLFSQLSVSNIYDMTSTGGVFTSNFFRTVAVDVNGDVWAGTNGQKLYRFNGNAWEPATTFTTQSFRYITPNPNGGIWVAQSGSTGTDAINGGVDFLDSTYVRTHYGSIDGLVSRFTTSLTRMDNGDIIAVHAPNTTGGVVSGGGINIISNGNVSSILNGLPSGTFANDRKCYAVGSNGSSEFWVGVERACNTSGVCNYGYIAKYDNLGNHLGNIDISNSLIPFTNTSASTIVRSIHFKNNKVFVGLFSGGIAVYDLTFNTWTMVNETNSLFPAGASVNNQAIYSVGSDVYIGTTAGLLIYNTNLPLTNSSSYQLINTGLPSNSINGISQAPDGHIWLATSTGIVEMASSSISGTVNNTSVGYLLGTIAHFPLQNAKVYIRDMWTSTYLDSAITNVSGTFSFPVPATSNPIKLEAYYYDNIDTFSCIIENVVPSNINVNLSKNLFEQVRDSLPTMGSFSAQMNYFWDFVNLPGNFSGYDHQVLINAVNQLKHLGPTDPDGQLEALARAVIFIEVMKKYGNEACELSSNTVSATFDFFKAVYADVYGKSKLNSDSYVSNLLSNAQKALIQSNLDQIKNNVNFLISKSCAYINDASLRQQVEASLKAITTVIMKAAEKKGLTTSASDLIVDEAKEFVKDVIVEIFSKALFEEYYIDKTKSNLNPANTNLTDGFTTSTFNTAITTAQDNITNTESLDSAAMSQMVNFNYIAQSAENSQSFLNSMATICAFTGVGIGYATVLKSLGTAAQILKYAYLAKSISKGAFRLRTLTVENNLASGQTFTPMLNTIPDNNFEPISMVELNTKITDYNNQLQLTLDFVQNSNRVDAFSSMLQLYQLDSILNKEYYIVSSSLLASASQYHVNTGNGDYLTENIVIGGIEENQQKRNGLYNFFSAYVIDSTDVSIVDSIVFFGNDVITTSLDLYDSLSFYNIELENIPIEPHLIDLGIISQSSFSQGETKNIKAVVRNIGQTDINDVYGKFYISGGFTAIQDSIYLGTISANQIDTFDYQISAPNFDTIVHFIIDVNSTNGVVEGIGGALIVNGGNTVQVSEIEIEKSFVKLWPNPVKNELSISTNSNAFNLQIFNLQGKLMHSSYSNGSALTVDVQRFENGLYLIQGVKDGSILFQDKFIKL
jgi:hypothetical protein